jgi:hypothetical protein
MSLRRKSELVSNTLVTAGCQRSRFWLGCRRGNCNAGRSQKKAGHSVQCIDTIVATTSYHRGFPLTSHPVLLTMTLPFAKVMAYFELHRVPVTIPQTRTDMACIP